MINHDGECTENSDGYGKWTCLKRSGKSAFNYSLGLMLTGRGGTRLPDFEDERFGASSGDVAKGPSGPIGEMYLQKGYPDKCSNFPMDKYQYVDNIPDGLSIDKSVSRYTRGLLPATAETFGDFAGDIIDLADAFKTDGLKNEGECDTYSVWTIDMAPKASNATPLYRADDVGKAVSVNQGKVSDSSGNDPVRVEWNGAPATDGNTTISAVANGVVSLAVGAKFKNPLIPAVEKGVGDIYRCCTQVHMSKADIRRLKEAGVKDCKDELVVSNVPGAESIRYDGSNPFNGKCMCQKIDAYGVDEGMQNMRDRPVGASLSLLIFVLIAFWLITRY